MVCSKHKFEIINVKIIYSLVIFVMIIVIIYVILLPIKGAYLNYDHYLLRFHHSCACHVIGDLWCPGLVRPVWRVVFSLHMLPSSLRTIASVFHRIHPWRR